LLDTIKLASDLSKVASALVDNSDLIASAITKITYQDKENKDDDYTMFRIMGALELLSAVSENSVDFIHDIIEKSTNLEYDEVGELDNEAGMDVLCSIYKVNKSFFQKLFKKLKEKMTSLTETSTPKKSEKEKKPAKEKK